MSTVNIQNATHLGNDPRMFLIIFNSTNVFLESRGNKPTHWIIKRLRDRNAMEVIDYTTGEVKKDAYGNIRMRDKLSTVLACRPADAKHPPASNYWRSCPADLWNAIVRGTWEHIFVPGQEIKDDKLLKQQKWFEPGMRVFKMRRHRINVGRDVARIEDLIRELEKRLESGQGPLSVAETESKPPETKSGVKIS